MKKITKLEIKKLESLYPVGTRVKLTKMDDKHAPPIGTEGTVKGIDSIGTIIVSWDNGSRLGVLFGIDECIKIN
ncbi:DUF4314 domain-containing protein [Gemelliphila palaticanis]|uniref:DUF4314 domain-containing protein n=1 Tax=Gemelliphila palaticanis TaxID=81950 RepID=A0ABX2T1J3_9BACL|nr:DUF4314 domain-containing protein [Gemella palaticanis]MBF0714956.1 DUF4314 domain-containing protein [Gemella palaticanis]NYS46886.1 DUF4314 domain-containing protein [Gemella palaticanis]